MTRLGSLSINPWYGALIVAVIRISWVAIEERKWLLYSAQARNYTLQHIAAEGLSAALVGLIMFWSLKQFRVMTTKNSGRSEEK